MEGLRDLGRRAWGRAPSTVLAIGRKRVGEGVFDGMIWDTGAWNRRAAQPRPGLQLATPPSLPVQAKRQSGFGVCSLGQDILMFETPRKTGELRILEDFLQRVEEFLNHVDSVVTLQ